MSFPAFPPIPQPPQRPASPTPAPLEERRGAVNRIEAMTGRVHRVQGFIDVEGAGETSYEVGFPVWFFERPLFTFGGEMADNEAPEAENFPTVSVVVLGWKKQEFDMNVSYWSGAYLGIVTTGRLGHRMTVHWQMEGKALRNPMAGASSTDVTL